MRCSGETRGLNLQGPRACPGLWEIDQNNVIVRMFHPQPLGPNGTSKSPLLTGLFPIISLAISLDHISQIRE